MKTTIKSLCGMLVLLAFAACDSNQDNAGSDNHLWDVTLEASMGDADNNRRTLSVEDHVITASFAENDEVVVVDADGSTIVGTLRAERAGTSTTLTGPLDASSLGEGEVVTLRYRSATANYDNQVGTLEGIADNQDYAEGTLMVSTTSPLTFTSNSVTLAAKQSITKFSFTDGSSPVSVKTFGIAATGLVQSIAKSGGETVGAVTGTLATASSDAYIALRNNSGSKQTYTFIVKDDADNWYKGTKKANLANGKNYETSVTLERLPALSSSDDAGTIGVIDGLPAIVVDFSDTKKAVALMNTGSLCPEDYGEYYTYDNRATGLPSGWYVPEQAELEALAAITNTWTTQNGVNGCTFTVGGNTLFLPAAGYYDNQYSNGLSNVTTGGNYWSSTNYNEGLAFYLSIDNTEATIFSQYKVDALTVRPFHALN